jgi:pilus assembly protein CpaE
MPVTIAVTAARGGAGRTTVAVNLAVLFAKRFPEQVALVDFHGQFGDVPLALDLTPVGGTGDLLGFDELDHELVRSQLMVHPASGLQVMAAPSLQSHPDLDLGRITIPFMASLLGLLRRICRFVFFDMPPLSWPTSQYVFTRSQRVLVVATLMDLHGIRNARSLIDIISAGTGDPQRISIIANRATRKGDYNLQDLENITGRSVYADLPDDPELACGALNTGVPVVLEAPNAALARGLVRLSEKLIGEL